MPISPMQFPELTNPYVAGQQMIDSQTLNRMRDTQNREQEMKNMYLPQQLQSDQTKANLANEMQKIALRYAPATSQAELEYKQQMAPHLAAQTQNLGLQNQYYAPNIQSEIAARNAQAALSGEQAKYYGANTKSEIASRDAAAAHQRFLNENPLLSLNGPAGQYGAVAYLKAHPELDVNTGAPQAPGNRAGVQINAPSLPTVGVQGNLPKPLSAPPAGINDPLALNIPASKLSDSLTKAINEGIEAKTAQGKLALKRAEGYNFTNMPIDTRSYSMAQAQSFGYDPLEASDMLLSGKQTLQDMAEAKGYGRDQSQWPTPLYNPNRTNVAQSQRRTALLGELDNISKTLTEWAAPYSRTVAGYSPKQLVEAFRGADPEATARFLASRALSPDLNAGRAKVMGSSNVGIEMLRHIGEKSNNEFKTIASSISPQVYKRYNELTQQVLNQGNQRFNDVLLRTRAAESPEEAKQGAKAANSGTGNKPSFARKDLEDTAKKYNMTVEQVEQKLNEKLGAQ